MKYTADEAAMSLAEVLVAHMERVNWVMQPHVRPEPATVEQVAECSEGCSAIRDLHAWVMGGDDVEDARHILAGIYGWYGTPMRSASTYNMRPETLKASIPHEAVMLAATCRMRIMSGNAVGTAMLGALAGVGPHWIRALAKDGEITIDNQGVTAEEARRWLSGRGTIVPQLRFFGVLTLRERKWWVITVVPVGTDPAGETQDASQGKYNDRYYRHQLPQPRHLPQAPLRQLGHPGPRPCRGWLGHRREA